MKFVIDNIHPNSKAYLDYHREVRMSSGPLKNDITFKEIFIFLEKSFGRASDIDAYSKVWSETTKPEWTYRISKKYDMTHQFFLSKKALEYFDFWYVKEQSNG